LSRELLIKPDAQADIVEAFDWYEQRRMRLGEEFLAYVEAGLAQIKYVPLRSSIIYKQVRRYLIQRFPYGIYYVVESDQIVVLAVMHASRDPQRWRERA
jgi:toxin ParE1/3/4